jgi:hypothetical protein
MSSNRREFLTTAAAVTGLGTLSLPLAAQGVLKQARFIGFKRSPNIGTLIAKIRFLKPIVKSP